MPFVPATATCGLVAVRKKYPLNPACSVRLGLSFKLLPAYGSSTNWGILRAQPSVTVTELSACPGDTSAAMTRSRFITVPPALFIDCDLQQIACFDAKRFRVFRTDQR